MRSPSESVLAMRMTLVNTFSMMERASPAMMSSGVLPRRCSETMLLFMNTVQRLPSTAGEVERIAASAMPETGMPSDAANPSRNDPQPLEQASLTMMSVMMPPSSQIAFISWPPMSSTNVASGTNLVAAAVCATVSTVWQSAWNARANRFSPYPVVPQARISISTPAARYASRSSMRALRATSSGAPSLPA